MGHDTAGTRDQARRVNSELRDQAGPAGDPEVVDGWFEACETLLEADPGRLHVIPGAEVYARLGHFLSQLDELGAETGQVDRVRGMAERWRASQPSAAEWFLDYRWLADQEHHAAQRRHRSL